MFAFPATQRFLFRVGCRICRRLHTEKMPLKFAANISMLYPNIPSLADRYVEAYNFGFKFVECTYPYVEPLDKLKLAKEKYGLEYVLMNSYIGNPAAGDRGLAAMPDRKEEFKEKLEMIVEYATALNCKRIHVLAGNTEGLDRTVCDETYLENIGYASDRFHKEGITCMIEPINRRVTIPGYYLSDIKKAVHVIDTLKRPNLKLQFDFFHIQILHGDLTENLKKYLPYIGHIQIAQVPDRDEPGFKGEIDYSYIFRILQDIGYDGYIGLEYTPKGDTVEGLRWLKDMNITL